MPTLQEITERIVERQLPVLFLDTCILLDIMRAVIRHLDGYVAKAIELSKLVAGSSPQCLLVLSSLIPEEWDRNVVKVAAEIDNHFRGMEEQSFRFHEACRALEMSPPFAKGLYTQVGLTTGLRDLSNGLLASSMILDKQELSRALAMDRLLDKIPPSRSGGQANDCVIIENYLSLCRELLTAQFVPKRVFCTSNIRDYCERANALHPRLAQEFEEVGLIFRVNLHGAIHALTH